MKSLMRLVSPSLNTDTSDWWLAQPTQSITTREWNSNILQSVSLSRVLEVITLSVLHCCSREKAEALYGPLE